MTRRNQQKHGILSPPTKLEQKQPICIRKKSHLFQSHFINKHNKSAFWYFLVGATPGTHE